MIKILKAIWNWFYSPDVKEQGIVEAKTPYRIIKFRKQQLIGSLHILPYHKVLRIFRVVKRTKLLTYKLELQ